ncbi:uncharacterized protein LOC143574461 [Bidens hawaiensis]|uniref:uncharacterized protein LOC143574461 n=1 Tax=Bidens hawaiensis TaxID=980011 RepID=UPI004048F0C5
MATMHTTLTVNNIRTLTQLTLDLENGEYASWVELFTIYCTVFEVLDHIFPTADSSSSSSTADKDKQKDKDPAPLASWTRLDAVVKQWIYGTISRNLLMNVIKPKATAKETWDTIAHLFQDSQASRAIALKTRFANTKLESFPNISA